MDKLLPCPFCGGEAELIERTIHGEPDCYVRCKNMCVTQCGKWSDDGCYLNISKEEAISAWNRRKGGKETT